MTALTTSFVLCIDVEPRGRHDTTGSVQEWAGFFTCLDYFTTWRQRLQAQTGREARFCWLLRLDEQIRRVYGAADWCVDRFHDPIAELQSADDVIGLHHHAYRRTDSGLWTQDYTDPASIREGIFAARNDFVRSMGYVPECVSIGAGWLDQATAACLDEAGFRYDMTLTPGRPAHPVEPNDLGRYEDYVTSPTRPFRPSRKDFLKPGRGGDQRDLWLLPVSTSCGFHPGEKHPGVGSEHRMDALNISLPPSFFRAHMEAQLAVREPVVLCLLRTGDVSEPHYDTAMRENGEYLLNHPRLASMAFETPAQAIARYTSRSRSRRPVSTSS